MPTLGGQTALNTAVALAENGTLNEFKVELIGANLAAIKKAEDRQLFKEAMLKIGLDLPKSLTVRTLEEGLGFAEGQRISRHHPPRLYAGGTGGGIAYNRQEFEEILSKGIDLSPIHQCLVEESALGWKEYEMEVMRDLKDNVVIICSIENMDPMGIHTGDSVTVAPAQTLTDKEYQRMRDASIACIREIGVDTGGSNIQFGVDPKTGRMVVIEMNPRVSRSSALASKATGFPIAKIAAKLADRLHPGRAFQRHHPLHQGRFRAFHRLRGHQDPPVHLREVPRRRGPPEHLHEERGGDHVHRPHLQGKLPEGPAVHGNRHHRPGGRRAGMEGRPLAEDRGPQAPGPVP